LPLVNWSLCSDELDVLEANSSLSAKQEPLWGYELQHLATLFLPGSLRRQLNQLKEILNHYIFEAGRKLILCYFRGVLHTLLFTVGSIQLYDSPDYVNHSKWYLLSL